MTLSVYRFDAEPGSLSPVATGIPAAPPGQPEGSAADVHVHPSGKFLYLSNRQGDQSNLAIFALDEATGAAALVGHEPTRGRTPRNFALSPDGRLLIVGNQDSNDIAVFRVDANTGRLAFARSLPVAPGPFFIGIYA